MFQNVSLSQRTHIRVCFLGFIVILFRSCLGKPESKHYTKEMDWALIQEI